MSKPIVLDFVQPKRENIPLIEWEGLRVVTTETLARGFECETRHIRQNLKNNRARFVEGRHFFLLGSNEIQSMQVDSSYSVSKHTTQLMLWTERGAALMSKIVDSDPAWLFHEKLVDHYFHAREQVAQPLTPAIPQDYASALRLAADLHEQNQTLTHQRDDAIRTKGQISNSREALAMQRLGYEKRQTRELQYKLNQTQQALNEAAHQRDQLMAKAGRLTTFATVLRVEKAKGSKFPYAALRSYCKRNNLQPIDVEHERYGSVKAWPAAAWRAVYGIDIGLLKE